MGLPPVIAVDEERVHAGHSLSPPVVAVDEERKHAGHSSSPLELPPVVAVDEERVHAGHSSSPPVVAVDEERVHAGHSLSPPVVVVDKERVHAGHSSSPPVVAVDEERVHAGHSSSPLVIAVDEERVHAGHSLSPLVVAVDEERVHAGRNEVQQGLLQGVKPKCLILDLNGLLIKRYRITYNRGKGSGWVSDDIGKMYQVITPPKPSRRAHFQYVIRPDAQLFMQSCGQLFSLVLWSSCTKENLDDAMQSCFPTLDKGIFKDMIGQDRCRKADFKLSDIDGVPAARDNSKPIFCKCLADFWRDYPNFNSENTLLVDDTRYKGMLNPWHTCICPPSFDPEDKEEEPKFLTSTLMSWLAQWEVSKNPTNYVMQNMMYNCKDKLSGLVMEHHSKLKEPRRTTWPFVLRHCSTRSR